MAVGKQTLLFPSNTVNTSNSFKLEEDVTVIKLVGLQDGDTVLVEVEVGSSECDKKYVPYSPTCCGQMKFCHPQNEFILTVPNRYRLLLTNRFDNHVTDPSWFENVEIFQSPVDSDNINLLKGCSDMSCGQEVTCSPDGVMIDGVLCPGVDTKITTITPAAEGWTVVMNDGTTQTIPLTSGANGIVSISGGEVEVDVQALANAICADANAQSILQACIDTQSTQVPPTSAEVCNALGGITIGGSVGG